MLRPRDQQPGVNRRKPGHIGALAGRDSDSRSRRLQDPEGPGGTLNRLIRRRNIGKTGESGAMDAKRLMCALFGHNVPTGSRTPAPADSTRRTSSAAGASGGSSANPARTRR